MTTTSSDESATDAWERMRAVGNDCLVVTQNDDIVGTLSSSTESSSAS